MKANIDVKDRKEAEAIRSGLEDPRLRTTVVVVGLLRPLSLRDRRRVMELVSESLEDEPNVEQGQSSGDGRIPLPGK